MKPCRIAKSECLGVPPRPTGTRLVPQRLSPSLRVVRDQPAHQGAHGPVGRPMVNRVWWVSVPGGGVGGTRREVPVQWEVPGGQEGHWTLDGWTGRWTDRAGSGQGSPAVLILHGGTLLEATAECPFRCSDVKSPLFCDPAGDPGVTLWSDWRAKSWRRSPSLTASI